MVWTRSSMPTPMRAPGIRRRRPCLRHWTMVTAWTRQSTDSGPRNHCQRRFIEQIKWVTKKGVEERGSAVAGLPRRIHKRRRRLSHRLVRWQRRGSFEYPRLHARSRHPHVFPASGGGGLVLAYGCRRHKENVEEVVDADTGASSRGLLAMALPSPLDNGDGLDEAVDRQCIVNLDLSSNSSES